jgi:hypothetical protein
MNNLTNSESADFQQACQYVCGQMSDDLQAQFEARLEHDETLVQHVIAAVQLSAGAAALRDSQGVRLVAAQPVLNAGRRRTQPSSSGMAVSLALIVCLLFLLLPQSQSVSRNAQVVASAAGDPSFELIPDLIRFYGADFSPADEVAADDLQEFESVAGFDELHVPDWLVTAVELNQSEFPSDEQLPPSDSTEMF